MAKNKMIWLIGSKGMLGTEIEMMLKAYSLDHAASDIETDITDLNILKKFASEINPYWIINCSAYTNVDKAEDEKENAFAVNSTGTKNIAAVALEKNANLIHISTDYVYDGIKPGEYHEDDQTCPINMYGASKLEGEKNILSLLNNYFIIRTAWLYGLNGPNFVKTMLRLFKEKESLNIVHDQFGSPTFTKDIASVIVNIIISQNSNFGIYNYTNEGKTSWFDFAREISRLAYKHNLINKEIEIYPINSGQYPVKAARPKNSYLSKSKIKQNMNIQIRDWETALEEYIIMFKELNNEKTK